MKHRSMSIGKASLVAFTLIMGGGLSASGALAASGGGGGSSAPSTDVTVCNQGWAYDKDKKICVKVQSMNDRQLYEQGRALAVAGHYEQALAALEAVRDRDDAMVLTMIGYSKRKLGAVEDGMAYYHRALAIDPDNINTREYLGEGYVSLGRLDLAQVELDRIEAICGSTCQQYETLAAAMDGQSDW